MGLGIAFEQALGVHGGIDLGGGKARMAQQFLDRAEVAALAEKVGGKGMAQRMGVAEGGRPRAERSNSIRFWISRGDRTPPFTPRKIGSSSHVL